MMLPQRKRLRLEQYDYSSPGAYFVTFCTHEKRCFLSEITVGAIHESPAVRLTEAGRCVQHLIEELPTCYPDLLVDHYAIMPNHVHLLLQIRASRAIRESSLQPDPKAADKRALLGKVIGYLKMSSSRQIHAMYPNITVWQRAYHDHVIRNEKDYREIWSYIDTNPARWRDDCLYWE